MPIYTYRCRSCGTEIDEKSSIADRDAPRWCACEDPKTSRMERVLTAPAVSIPAEHRAA